ncbi:unnamed protein product [Paramecium octaurelia]|uniref:Uncharacterized protein n=1 Tax=Paramecium octaurelia TaxID=43137 RepID=A0A8S1XMB2_PAROT|nr:unnamed protein product [Paramecium octaurelia]
MDIQFGFLFSSLYTKTTLISSQHLFISQPIPYLNITHLILLRLIIYQIIHSQVDLVTLLASDQKKVFGKQQNKGIWVSSNKQNESSNTDKVQTKRLGNHPSNRQNESSKIVGIPPKFPGQQPKKEMSIAFSSRRS